MARLIGEKPTYPGEIEFYEFAMREIPDYVYVMFNVEFNDGIRIREADAILLVPHIGVFVIEIKACSYIFVKQGQILMLSSPLIDPRPYRPKQLLELRNITRQHIWEKFHVTPFVYEIHCFPRAKSNEEAKEELAKAFGSELVFFAEDLVDCDEFMLKLNVCRMQMNKLSGDKNRYCDLTDTMAHNMYKYWETGMDNPARPSKPPYVFLSYNRLNLQVAEELKAELENRGIFVWKAPEDVPLSENYLPEEMKAIEACDSFLILLSSSSQESMEVRKEFDKAVELNKHIIPLRIQDIELNEYFTKAFTAIQHKDMFKLNSVIINDIERCIREHLDQ